MADMNKSMRQRNGDGGFVATTGLVVFAMLGALSVWTGGCNKKDIQIAEPPRITEVKTPAEIRRSELLSRLEKKFEDPQAHYELGHLYQDDGLWAKAQYHYSVALTFDPSHRPAQAAMVKALAAAGDVEKSKLSADIYLDQVSGSATESTKLALEFQKEALDEHALAAYKQALRLAPTSALINRQIGYYYLSKNNIDLAKEYLTRSFQLNPNQPDVAGELGRLGVAVQIPRKTGDPKKVDKMVESGSTP